MKKRTSGLECPYAAAGLRCLLLLLLAVLIVACQTEIDMSQAIERNGIVYAKSTEKPFTGVVTGQSRHEGYRRVTVSFKKEYKDGLLNGRSYYYYLNGKIESIEPYVQGTLDGVVTRYYENGQIKARVHFVDGYRGGSKGEMFWDQNGHRRNG